MRRDLNWFQARKLARVEGANIRRESWHRWLQFDRSVYLWFIWQPEGEPALTDDGTPTFTTESRGVVRASQFGVREFLAFDWTDEDWDLPPQPPDTNGGGTGEIGGGGDTGGTGAPGGTGGTGDNGGGGTGNNNNAGGEGGNNTDGGSGGTDGTEGNTGGGSDSGGGGTFGNSGGGDNTTGGTNQRPPRPRPPMPDYTPVVTVTLDPEIDGPDCFIVEPRPCRAVVSFTIPHPAGGTLLAGITSATCFGQMQIVANGGPGGGGACEFHGHVTGGQKVVAPVTFSAGDGVHTWTGAGEATVAVQKCILAGYTWSGTQTVEHTCPPSGYSGEETGYNLVDEYSATRLYAIKPTPGTNTGVAYGENLNLPHNRKQTLTDLVSGGVTENELYVVPPTTINATVVAGEVTHVEPALLGIFPDDFDSGEVPDGICTTHTTSTESGPND